MSTTFPRLASAIAGSELGQDLCCQGLVGVTQVRLRHRVTGHDPAGGIVLHADPTRDDGSEHVDLAALPGPLEPSTRLFRDPGVPLVHGEKYAKDLATDDFDLAVLLGP